jgi:superfamily II RNA helicase
MVKIFSGPFPKKLEETYKVHFSAFGYDLSDFQKHSIRALVEGHNSLVTASTGSGKSTPAEFAIRYFAQLGKRVVYTAPVKALSNQKYHDFALKFQNDNISVGLLTGDIKANDSADVVVMTTEILHNQLQNGEFNSVADAKNELKEVGCVIFDEIHYINDSNRGNIWEESIIMLSLLKDSPSLLMLSATIATPQIFADWIEQVGKREVWIATSNVRVVPLTHYTFMTCKSLDKIKDRAVRQNIRDKTDMLRIIKEAAGGEPYDPMRDIEATKDLLNTFGVQPDRKLVIQKVCKHIYKNGMPCIIFVFSRKQVIECATELSENFQSPGIDIEKECESIIGRLPNFLEYLYLPDYVEVVDFLKRGIAVHHGGMLSVVREMVEIMFDRGFVKVLFATETFAAGINLPVKSVVFTQLHKYSGEGRRNLYPYEYTQMAGRAGRRGIDSAGSVIHLYNLYGTSSEDIKTILNNEPQSFKSKLKISYNMVLAAATAMGTQKSEECVNYSIISNSMLKTEIDKKITFLTKRVDKLRDKMSACSSEHQRSAENYRQRIREIKASKKMDPRWAQEEKAKAVAALKGVPGAWSLRDDERELKQAEEKLSYYDNFIQKKINSIEDMLLENGFLDGMQQKTKRGTVALRIKKANPLLLGQLVDCGFLKQYQSIELAALLSCFVQGKQTEKSPARIPKMLKLSEMAAMNARLVMAEKKHNINFEESYRLNYKLIRYVLKWCDAKNEVDCKEVLNEVNISVGDFVKSLLEITNIAEELYKACEYVGETELCDKLQQIPDLLLKYIASPQSLYV